MNIHPDDFKISSWPKRFPYGENLPCGVKVKHLPTGIIVKVNIPSRRQHDNHHLAMVGIEEMLKEIK
jgi:protein subunit release factor A